MMRMMVMMVVVVETVMMSQYQEGDKVKGSNDGEGGTEGRARGERMHDRLISVNLNLYFHLVSYVFEEFNDKPQLL